MTPLPRSLVAVGDSFTEGMSDEPGPDGRHRGWADRVAAALALQTGGLRYANLAVRGKLLDQVVAEQLPVAVALAPEAITFHAGPNDVLRPRCDAPALLVRYDDAVARLRATGATVVLFTAIERTGGSGRTAERLATRFAAFNAGVRRVAADRGCLLVDAGAVAALQDRRLFDEDRLHLAPAGHARIAAAVLEGLGVRDPALLGGEPGWWTVPVPARARPGPGADLLADVRWVRRHLLPWVGRRLRRRSSGDAVVAKHAELVDVTPRPAPEPR